MDIITNILVGLGTLFAAYVINNTTLKDGLTHILLRWMNKVGIKKIPLATHKVFLLLRNYENQLNLLIFNSELKSKFYKIYISVIFKNLQSYLQSIIKDYDTVANLDTEILTRVDKAISDINLNFEKTIRVPQKVQHIFTYWKMTTLQSYRANIESTLYDDLIDNKYFKVYRILDLTVSFNTFMLNTGATLFATMNGAFDNLKEEDVILPTIKSKVITEHKDKQE